MARRHADLDPAVLRRAVKLALLPGVTRTQVGIDVSPPSRTAKRAE